MPPISHDPAVTPAPIGAGVIGLGEIGQVHVEGYQRAAGARVAAVTDLDSGLTARTAEATTAIPHADYEALLADDSVELVSICLPHNLHRETALAAIEAGKHVLVEKPLALNVEECDEIIDAAERRGVKVGVSHNQLFYPPHVRARELIEAGALGRPILLRLRLAIGGKFSGWRSDPRATGGGLLFDAGVHRFYVARALFGEISEVCAILDAPRERGEDVAVVSLRFSSGAFGVIEANYHSPNGAFDDAIEVTGSEATLYLSGCEAEFVGFRTGPALRRYDGSWHDERVPPGSWDDSVHASVAGFVEAVAAGAEPPVSAVDGRAIVETITRVYEVARVAALP
jgi:UDP-N-acetylglucosamine 3-dehydrogenase